MKLGNAIKLLRTETGVSQKSFAKQLGITGPYLSQVENDRKVPSLELLRGISNQLQISVPMLIMYAMEPEDIPKAKRSFYSTISPLLKDDIRQLLRH